MKYKGHIIKRVQHQDTTCYKVTTPGGETWAEVAANLKTARKWINTAIAARLAYIRREIVAERVSYGEIHELQCLSRYIDRSDVLLLQWAGVPESKTT